MVWQGGYEADGASLAGQDGCWAENSMGVEFEYEEALGDVAVGSGAEGNGGSKEVVHGGRVWDKQLTLISDQCCSTKLTPCACQQGSFGQARDEVGQGKPPRLGSPSTAVPPAASKSAAREMKGDQCIAYQ